VDKSNPRNAQDLRDAQGLRKLKVCEMRKIRGMRKFSGSHSSDALYQGPTLVGPLRSNKDLGFSPA
jgi:hypothetical protein